MVRQRLPASMSFALRGVPRSRLRRGVAVWRLSPDRGVPGGHGPVRPGVRPGTGTQIGSHLDHLEQGYYGSE